ncbi:MAG: hypothetical protein Q4A71_03655 [Actinomycetaceae bacterium]|nr:hypothetical protein [Actinomycetaceae bacterium]
MTTTWIPVEGALLAASLDPRKVAEKFTELGVVAELDWYESTSHLLGLTLLTNENDRVATIAKGDENFSAGMPIDKVVKELAATFKAEVWTGESWHDGVPEGTKFPKVKENTGGEVRSVEITRMPAASVPFVAVAEGVDLGCVELSEDARAIIRAGTEDEITSVVLLSDAPAISLQATNDDMRLVAIDAAYEGRSESMIIHSWNMTTRIVMGGWGPDEAPAGLLALARNKFGEDDAASRLVDILPSASRVEVENALVTPGRAGFDKMVKALGLPNEIKEFLAGQLPVADAAGMRFYPATDWTKAFGSSFDLMLESPTPENKVFNAYRTAVVEKPWLVRTWAALEGTLGGTLLTLSLRTSKKTGWTKLAGIVGGGLILDALMQVGLATYIRQRWQKLTTSK